MKGSGLLFNSSSWTLLFLNVGILAGLLYVIWGILYLKYKHNVFSIIVLSLVTAWLVYYHYDDLFIFLSFISSTIIGSLYYLIKWVVN